MKKIFFIFCLVYMQIAFTQGDSLNFKDEVEVGMYVFNNFSSGENNNLLNRNLQYSIDEMRNGLNSKIHSIINWSNIFSTISTSYLDSNDFISIETMAIEIINYFYEVEFNNPVDELIQPFGLIIHNSTFIDSINLKNGNISVVNNQWVSNVPNDSVLFEKVMIESAALLEFYPDNGYYQGKLIYDSRFILTSEDVTISSIKIDLNDGNGFQDFGENNPVLVYDRYKDSTVATAKVKYTFKDSLLETKIRFLLTTKSNLQPLDDFKASSKDDKWDEVWEDYDPLPDNDLKYTVAIKYGCGNNNKIRRPLIFSPPYRPTIQGFSLNKYWNQFNIGGLFDSYVGLGYDIILIKEKPGNVSLEEGGIELSTFIREINKLKKENYPGEYWENILFGYSKGGQVARYALMYLEKLHMEAPNNLPVIGDLHHHTRLYAPFDSPHHGASIPIFAQTIYEYFADVHLVAAISYMSLMDEASTDMGLSNIAAKEIVSNTDNDFVFIPKPHSNAINYQNSLNNDFVHAYTHTGDQRKKYPTFTRNIAVSTGSYNNNYSSYFDWDLAPGMLVYKSYNNTPFSNKILRIWASEYSASSPIFERTGSLFHVKFSTVYAYEWDMAQGGYKNNFYDETGGAIPIINDGFGFYHKEKIYTKKVNFLPLVSALGINPNIWQNNNLYYNLQDELMFYNGDTILNQPFLTDRYGYPHLGHPANHFSITPFEAVYADQFTFDHIVMNATVQEFENDLGVGQSDLDSCRDFLNDEVEAWNFALQNKVIGENHVIDPNYEYVAWYKARGAILIGNNVTPKTNPGDYVIKNTGNITVYARDAVIIQPGFHAQAGAEFHAFIKDEGCGYDYLDNKVASPDENNTTIDEDDHEMNKVFLDDKNMNKGNSFITLYPNPNTGQFIFEINDDTNVMGQIYVYNLTGQLVYQQKITTNKTQINPSLDKGVYVVEYKTTTLSKTIKMIVQ